MFCGVSPEAAVRFTRLSMYLAFCWPPPRDSTKRQIAALSVFWWISFLSSIGLLGPLLISIYQFHSDPLVVTKSTIFSLAIANFAIKIIVCRLNRQRMQELIYEMNDYMEAANPRERKILQSYVDRCKVLHSTLTIIYYFTTAAVVCGPLVLPQTFPTNAVYPFPVESTFVFILIYAHQAFVGFQCSTGLTIDSQSAMLLWFAGARFQILAEDAVNVDKLTFHDFVREHQNLLNYADKVRCAIRYVVLTTATMTGVGTAFSGLQLISPQPLMVKVQFLAVLISTSLNLYTCAWPADNLQVVSNLIGDSLYNCAWPEFSPEMMKNCLIIIRRTQRPVIVSVGGFIPILSLQYYGSFLSNTFSYFTTLRMTMAIDNTEA